MKKRLISLILATTVVASLLTGCGSSSSDDPNDLSKLSKSELIDRVNADTVSYNLLYDRYDELNTMYQALTTEDQPTAAVSLIGDGSSSHLTFNSVDSKIIFPTSFQYPNSTTTQSNGSVSIVNNVTISPTSNWVMKLNGTTLEIEHTSGISGTIKLSGISEQYDKTLLKDQVLSQWFTGISDSSIVYKDIFVDGQMYGVQATTPTMIDSEDAYLRCGMLGIDEFAITYIFVYRGTQDSTKDECITNLLNTIKVRGSEFQVQD